MMARQHGDANQSSVCVGLHHNASSFAPDAIFNDSTLTNAGTEQNRIASGTHPPWANTRPPTQWKQMVVLRCVGGHSPHRCHFEPSKMCPTYLQMGSLAIHSRQRRHQRQQLQVISLWREKNIADIFGTRLLARNHTAQCIVTFNKRIILPCCACNYRRAGI